MLRFAEELSQNGIKSAIGKSFLKIGNQLVPVKKAVPVKNSHDIVIFPEKVRNIEKEFCTIAKKYKRIAIFASFSTDGLIHKDVIYYLTELKKVTDAIVFIADNPIIPQELDKLKDLVIYAKCARHQEYDFGSYKCGYIWTLEKGLLAHAEELLLCNDSCYGPVYPFSVVFQEMENRVCDFWGMIANDKYNYHLQSYFLLLKKRVFLSNIFKNYIRGIKKENSFTDVVKNYEVKLTNLLLGAGYSYSSYVNYYPHSNLFPYISHNVTQFPIWALKNKFPFIKKKMLLDAADFNNVDGLYNTYQYLKIHHPEILNLTGFDSVEDCNQLYDYSFSIVMPTLNRKYELENAIESVLKQSYQNFELIIIDDGSTDGTKEWIEEKYFKEVKDSKIRYFYVDHVGVSKARNRGLVEAKNNWIAYVDSDNIITGDFLETFCKAIHEAPFFKLFYAKAECMNSGTRIGRPLNFKRLLEMNYIDLGTFIHARSVYEDLGGFDENMTRLVDWDLIATYTKRYPAQFINRRVMLYFDGDDPSRISIKENLYANLAYFRKKHPLTLVITFIIPEKGGKYFRQVLDSALSQVGGFKQKIIVIDKGDSEEVTRVLDEYIRFYPQLLGRIASREKPNSQDDFLFQNELQDNCYVNFILGDEFSNNERKLDQQLDFLQSHRDCGMVFSNELHYDEKHHIFYENFPEVQLSEVFTSNKPLPENIIGKRISLTSCLFDSSYAKEIITVLKEKNPQEIPLFFYVEYFGKIGYLKGRYITCRSREKTNQSVMEIVGRKFIMDFWEGHIDGK